MSKGSQQFTQLSGVKKSLMNPRRRGRDGSDSLVSPTRLLPTFRHLAAVWISFVCSFSARRRHLFRTLESHRTHLIIKDGARVNAPGYDPPAVLRSERPPFFFFVGGEHVGNTRCARPSASASCRGGAAVRRETSHRAAVHFFIKKTPKLQKIN